MSDFPINYLAVLVAALATVFIGAIWYSPIMFHEAWLKAHGHSEEKIVAMRKTACNAFLVSLPCYMVMALVQSLLSIQTPPQPRRALLSAFLYGSGSLQLSD